MLIHRIFDEYDFALIDPIISEGFPESVATVPLLPAGLEDSAHLLPALIDLRALAQESRDALLEWIEQAPSPPLSALLATRADRGRIMRHLAGKLVVRLADGSRSLLRVHDPRVFAHLRWILNERQLAQMLGPIRHWHYWHVGRWRVLESPGTNTGATSLSEGQCAHLWRVDAINAFFAQHGVPEDEHEFTARARALSGCIGRAQIYGWRKRADWLAFAQLCSECHPEFDRHPRIVELIEGLDEDEADFRDAIALIDEDGRRRIADELTNRLDRPNPPTASAVRDGKTP